MTTQSVIDELFPAGDDELKAMRKLLDQPGEEGDGIDAIYSKSVDYLRTVPREDGTVRVMTLMASKGIEADHASIIGCNAGNIPGTNRSSHITDFEHKEERRRLLYLGFTRVKKSLTVSRSQLILFPRWPHENRPCVAGSIPANGGESGQGYL